MSRFAFSAALAAAFFAIASPASAHGVIGDRFFPATIATEDPFVSDELALPTISHFGDETEIALDYGKRLTSRLGVSLGGAWTHGPDGDGFQNIETGLKYQIVSDAAQETIASLGLEVEWGGAGAERVGAEGVTTIAPTFYFGRGFGDASADWFRPFAVTGSVGYVMPIEAHNDLGEATPHAIEYGVALEYSLRYLAANVRDRGWPNWVNQLTPVVEIALDQPVRHRGDERTTGTINPGLLWSGRRVQIGAGAIIPVNDASGDDVGFAVQAHFYLDDMFPRSIGRPIFGARR